MGIVGIILILGSEDLLAERAIAETINGLNAAPATFLDGESIEIGDITDSLAPSLFAVLGEARIVVVKAIQELSAECSAEILDFLNNPDIEIELVLWHKGGVKGKALLDQIKKSAMKIIEIEVIKKDSQRVDFVQSEFSRLGRKISSAAVQAIVDALGSDLRELSAACSQLASDVVVGKSIERGDVEKFQQGKVETSGFDVADAVMEGKTDRALIALRQAVDSGVDPVLVVNAISASLRTLGKVSGVTKGVRSYDLASSLGLAPWQIDKARNQLSNWTPARLSSAVMILARTDAEIKGAAADPGYALERCVIAISGSHGPEISV
jgi:DNA polymerase-3 subunit delta